MALPFRTGLLVLSTLAAALPQAPAPPEVDLGSIPAPAENLEQGVAEQLGALRREIEVRSAQGVAGVELGRALGQLGRLYLLYDQMAPAEACLLEAGRLAPEDFAWPYYLAVLYSFEGEPDRIEEALLAALEIEPRDPAALVRLGDLQLERGELEAAAESYRRVLDADPGSSAARFGRGRIRLARGEVEEAVADFEAALGGQPEGSVVHYFLGMAYRRLGDRERARAELERNRHLRIVFPDPLFEELLQLNASRQAHFDRGVKAMRRGDATAAVEAFQTAIGAQPDDAEAHYNVGMALGELERKEEAERYLRRAVELRPHYRNAHFNLALMLARRGAYDEAAAHFARVSEIDPEDLRSRMRWADAVARLGEPERALAELEAVLEADPALVRARLILGRVQAELGRREEAAASLRAILELAPGAVEERGEAHYRLAVLTPQADEEQKLSHLRAALELDPGLVEAQELLAGELARARRFDAAADAFRRLVELEPQSPQARFSLGMALILGGAFPEARIALEASLEALPASLPLAHVLARLLATCPDPRVRDGERALELSQRVVRSELSIDHAETLAMAYAELGRFEEAIAWQQRVLSEGERLGREAGSAHRRLELYREGKPVRAPWLDG